MRLFLQTIWGVTDLAPYWGELRIGGSRFLREFYQDIDSLVERALEADSVGMAAYYGVLLRTKASTGADYTVPSTQWLWADIDTKAMTRLEAIERINALQLLPTMLVDSGNGFHAYWKLKHPVAVDDAAEVMKGIADELQSDHVQNPGRILRLPGTHNYKTDPPHEVRLLWASDKVYRLSLFERFLKPLIYIPTNLPRVLKRFEGNLDEAYPVGSRSEADYRTVLQMIEAGWSDTEIVTAFQQHPNGIGGKYAEKGKSGDKYLELTIKNAKAYLGLV
jgi:hypothetical protein